ncbi:MAG TPA: hypothetical protein VFT22_34185 [Kofleriaceae bacterium]|nr:hypothetical protein [Kofleriaceae bacterium]
MTRVVLWLSLLGVAALATGCSVSHRSEDFACGPDSRCAGNRVCIDGLCVIPDDAGVRPDARQGSCPAQCTSCDGATKTCTIDCAVDANACAQRVTCPTGWSCEIACSTPNACRSGIICTNAKACTITCAGRQSCDTVVCGAGPCNVDCSGRDSCNEVSCGPSCACDVTCQFVSSCAALSCTSADCTSLSPFGGCTSEAQGCNTCP